MDDESGWGEILIQGWQPRVRTAVAARVEEGFTGRRGLLAATALDPDDVPGAWVEQVHVAVVAGIAAETGADIEALGSQAAWATYEDVWQALATRAARDAALVAVPERRVGQVCALLADLPVDAAMWAGGVPWPDRPVAPVVIDGRSRVHLDGTHRWLATEQEATEGARMLARALIAVVRDDPIGS